MGSYFYRTFVSGLLQQIGQLKDSCIGFTIQLKNAADPVLSTP